MIIVINNDGGEKMCACDLKKGSTAVIRSIDFSHKSAARLVEMGFTPGSPIEVIGSSPFGDPLMLRIRGYSVAVRRRDLAAVEVIGC